MLRNEQVEWGGGVFREVFGKCRIRNEYTRERLGVTNIRDKMRGLPKLGPPCDMTEREGTWSWLFWIVDGTGID